MVQSLTLTYFTHFNKQEPSDQVVAV